MSIFFELHQDLPREGPGDNESTRRALALIPGLPARPMILDVGCGPGMQTLELARQTGGQIVAVDTHQPFLNKLEQSARQSGYQEQITTRNVSMVSLDFEPASFDLIWSEGAIYIMGFEQGLRLWRKFLKPGGCIAVTEISWIRPEPPAELAAYWNREYPAMHSTQENLASLAACGYRSLGHFVLPETSWWENYYNPLAQRLARLRAKYAGDPEANQLLDANQLEMEFYRKYSAWYGYVFYVMQIAQ